MHLRFDGLIPAVVLPMTRGGDPDLAAFRRYLRWIREQGILGIAVNVDTGESPHLTHSEKVRLVAAAREELLSDQALVAGLSGPFTAQAVEQARDYQQAGADALLVFPIPAYLSEPLNPAIPVTYHQRIADVGIPLILFQLHAAGGGVNFAADTLRQLATIPGVVAIKDASFDARQFARTLATIRELNNGVAVLTGNDNFILESLIMGADGALLGFGSIMTREQVDLVRLVRSQKYSEAKSLGARIQHLADVIFAPPNSDYRARLKEALVALGILDQATVREPLLPLGKAEQLHVRNALVDAGLLSPSGRSAA